MASNNNNNNNNSITPARQTMVQVTQTTASNPAVAAQWPYANWRIGANDATATTRAVVKLFVMFDTKTIAKTFMNTDAARSLNNAQWRTAADPLLYAQRAEGALPADLCNYIDDGLVHFCVGLPEGLVVHTRADGFVATGTPFHQDCSVAQHHRLVAPHVLGADNCAMAHLSLSAAHTTAKADSWVRKSLYKKKMTYEQLEAIKNTPRDSPSWRTCIEDAGVDFTTQWSPKDFVFEILPTNAADVNAPMQLCATVNDFKKLTAKPLMNLSKSLKAKALACKSAASSSAAAAPKRRRGKKRSAPEKSSAVAPERRKAYTAPLDELSSAAAAAAETESADEWVETDACNEFNVHVVAPKSAKVSFSTKVAIELGTAPEGGEAKLFDGAVGNEMHLPPLQSILETARKNEHTAPPTAVVSSASFSCSLDALPELTRSIASAADCPPSVRRLRLVQPSLFANHNGSARYTIRSRALLDGPNDPVAKDRSLARRFVEAVAQHVVTFVRVGGNIWAYNIDPTWDDLKRSAFFAVMIDAGYDEQTITDQLTSIIPQTNLDFSKLSPIDVAADNNLLSGYDMSLFGCSNDSYDDLFDTDINGLMSKSVFAN